MANELSNEPAGAGFKPQIKFLFVNIESVGVSHLTEPTLLIFPFVESYFIFPYPFIHFDFNEEKILLFSFE
jgi:hypothetical protein